MSHMHLELGSALTYAGCLLPARWPVSGEQGVSAAPAVAVPLTQPIPPCVHLRLCICRPAYRLHLVLCPHTHAARCLSPRLFLYSSRVYRQHQRPQFPSGTWPKYQHLAERCWSPHPEDRPHIGQIIHTLQQLLDTAGGPFTCASPFAQDIEGPGDSSSACC